MRLLTAISLLFLTTGGAVAQNDPTPKFDVSSVKPAAPDARGTYINSTPGGQITITNMSLKEMIVLAYRVQPHQVSGATGWMESERYDVVAKPETKPKDGEIPVMLKGLLTDRFGLALHSETRELPVYALVVVKPGKLGPGLTESKPGSCTELDRTKPLPPREPGKELPVFCGGFMMGMTSMRGSGVPLASLLNVLGRRLGRTVVDETGLTGNFDINMVWVPEEGTGLPSASDNALKAPPGVEPKLPGITDAVIFTALPEQLGLKLQSKKGPVEIWAIERAAKPEAN